jgi:hypothetical protein
MGSPFRPESDGDHLKYSIPDYGSLAILFLPLHSILGLLTSLRSASLVFIPQNDWMANTFPVQHTPQLSSWKNTGHKFSVPGTYPSDPITALI